MSAPTSEISSSITANQADARATVESWENSWSV